MKGRRSVEVIGVFQKDGTIYPEKVLISGVGYPVTVRRVTQMEETKAGGSDIRYDVIIGSKAGALFFESADSYTDKRKWFIA